MQTKSMWCICGGVFLLLVSGFVLWRVQHRSAIDSSQGAAGQEGAPLKTYTSVSGQRVDKEVAERRVMAVMIENHPDSRPQSGLSRAEVVYEMVAEGGITRFLAIFQQDAKDIGPVRSARDYFAEIADSWRALYAHVGGSPEALTNIKSGTYKNLTDINEFYQGSFFTRIKSRLQPHNTYTSTEKLQRYGALQSTLPSEVRPFIFSDTPTQVASAATEITLNFSTESYRATFTYDPVTKTYQRSIAGKKDIDALTGRQLAPTTVVVQLTDTTPVPGDEKLRMNIRTTGSGKVYIFKNGGVVTGTWKREQGKPAQYLDATNNSIALAPGQIWIALVSDTDVSVLSYK